MTSLTGKVAEEGGEDTKGMFWAGGGEVICVGGVLEMLGGSAEVPLTTGAWV